MSTGLQGSILVIAVVLAGCGRGGELGQAEAGAVPADGAGISASLDEGGNAEASSESGGVVLPDGLLARPERTAAAVQEAAGAAAACPTGMVLVAGEYCPYVGHRCVDFIDEKADRCAKYAPPPLCEGKLEKRRFCMDRYEYPNLPGVKPAVMMNWVDAMEACVAEGKRLCLSTEWTMACEGAERLPYPYGYERDKRVCNFDRPRPSPEPDMEAFSYARKVGREVARLDLRVESGVLQGCVSPFGAHDLTGNVDEWVINEQHFDKELKEGEKQPFISGLKGGYWGPIRARCRPITPSHNEWFKFYQVGFRCCSDAQDSPDGVASKYMKKMGRFLRPRANPISAPNSSSPAR